MSKYDRLRVWLMEARGDRTPMTFLEIETLLEFPLPASARTHRPWWANTPGGHSHALAWLDAGWRTAAVNLERERLVFVRKPIARKRRARPAATGHLGPAQTPDAVVIPRALLSADAVRLIEDLARSTDSDVAAAAAALLNQSALERRLSTLSPPLASPA